MQNKETLTEQEIENHLNKKLGWFEKRTLKKTIKKLQKTIQKEQKDKTQLIQAINSMNDVVTLYEDDQKTIPTTQKHLQQKTIQELETLLNEILEGVKDLI